MPRAQTEDYQRKEFLEAPEKAKAAGMLNLCGCASMSAIGRRNYLSYRID
ncbi:hypothetical protein HMPREF9439_00955 [Parasutterella excrementihominis YIT 11859]|uniref:Uncharacterized protein n=1 Tax=Parasutterella excrementihominis YIT 11859 TaxID=762966 RepID=F3QJ55_9BURK|nr:hypothetical protein HMPREF9439_00955 [Parasutterella excrementihominis YIT 11859]